MQRTIAREAGLRGIGFLTEADVRLRFLPAEADTGVVFRRADLPGSPPVPAHVRHVVPRQRRTSLQAGDAAVEMVEHVMAALAGLRVDNCVVELDAAETPGCDGSSRPFVEALLEAGIEEQDRPRAVVTIDRPITVREGKAALTAHPGETDGLILTYNLDFGAATPIGRQSLFFEVEPGRFRDEIAPSRTFLLEPEAMALKQAGLGSRLSESDLLIFGPEGPINNTLRFPDECVRHKILDMVGDLALAGVDIVGHVVAHRSGHQLNAELVRTLLEQADLAPAPPCAVGGSVLDIRSILELLPHRYPFLLVDRVLELEVDRRILAIKNVTINEPFFQGHWPSRPIMPGVLILEALAQTAGLLISQKFDTARYDAVIAAMDDVKLRRPVVPGDQLRLQVCTRRVSHRLLEVEGMAHVGDQVAAQARIRFGLVEKERLGAA
jgi:UDP-3-O-[3-hydroxymyristoyl] N-acetylglucosamine deacetylase/3-hydroxyacyl-[acyl-carrier-protein] dehydratase